jgi:acetylornithine/N-succinyldiaminopimelate aminotransferase
MNIQERDQNYIAHTYGRYPAVLTRGEGCMAYDESGKAYIDLTSGIGVNIFGYCDPAWKQAVEAQLDCIQHTSNLYYTRPCVELAELLCQKTGMKKVFFGNSGAEANEGAIKAARKYAAVHHGRDTYNIITLKDSFHGRTITTLAATGQEMFHHDFQPLTPGFLYAQRNNPAEMEQLVKENKIAAIMIECIQGEGGVHVLDQAYVQGIQKICDEKDILLIVDEVQTGNGRTGRYFAYMNYGIHPDLVTTAKGLGGGLPIGAVLFNGKCQDVFQPGDHGSTFGGNPIAAAGGVSIVERIDDTLLQDVRAKGEKVQAFFRNDIDVKAVEGMGLMIGIEPAHRSADEVLKQCMAHGVLVLTAHDNRVRLLPPLNIPEEKLMEACEVIRKALA